VESAELAEDGRANVSLARINRLSRELKGEPQPQAMWMSVT
jgi:hypothetical protein